MFRSTKISIVALLTAMLMVACSGLSSSINASSGLLDVPVVASNPVALQSSSSTPASLETYQATLEQIYAGVNPSVVNVEVVESATSSSSSFQTPGSPFDFGGPGAQLQQRALGSGFVWDNQGHIVTNNHVVDGASKITVTFSNGTTAVAKLVGADPNSDLAVINGLEPG
jgi:S1-C subfamily serine protease